MHCISINFPIFALEAFISPLNDIYYEKKNKRTERTSQQAPQQVPNNYKTILYMLYTIILPAPGRFGHVARSGSAGKSGAGLFGQVRHRTEKIGRAHV